MRALAVAAGLALAGCGAMPEPPCDLAPDAPLDGRQCAALRAMALPATLPPARGNLHGDDIDAAVLGFAVFFDARFSSNQNVRCATCHLPERRFGDGEVVSTGLERVERNSPTALDAARYSTWFWDGRADTLWSQPLFAFESPEEMNFTRLEIAHLVASLPEYAAGYEKVFGALPALDDAARFPARGAPGDPAFDGMADGDKEAVDRVAANVGKALEAYQRKLATGRSRFDRFLGGDRAALGEAERRGMVTFATAGCAGCHGGPLLSDEKFHNLGVAAWPDEAIDRGRALGREVLAANPFNAQGRFYDGEPPPAPPPASDADEGAFRTPSLRDVARSAPYFHNGRAATLADAVRFHTDGGGRPGDRFAGRVDPLLVPRPLGDGELADLVAFLSALDGAYPVLPWATWPM